MQEDSLGRPIITKEDTLKYALECLEEAKFSFACFVDAFKRYIDYEGKFKEIIKELTKNKVLDEKTAEIIRKKWEKD